MAFRYEGVAWDGQHWQVVPSIETLGMQIEDARGPGTYPTDGTVASRAHDAASPTSHHSPDGNGWVRAIDFGGSADFIMSVVEAIRLSEDPRIVYVIHNGRIFSSYAKNGIAPYTWRHYSGSNPHVHHAHVSVRHDVPGDDAPWSIGEDTEEVPPVAELKDYEVAAIERCEAAGVFTEYTTDDPGEVEEFVPIKTLAVFFDRILDYVDSAVAAGVAPELPDLSDFIKRGEEVTLT